MSENEGRKSILNGDHRNNPGIGLALGGGMARGFAHIGVLNVLRRHNIEPGIVAGTSIGAVVAGCYLANRLNEFTDWALSLNRLTILSYLDFRIRSAGMIGGNKLSNLLENHFGDMIIEDLPKPLITIAADLVTGHEVWIRKGPLVEAMRASFALPGVFPPVERNGRLLVDGALINPCPVAPCQAMGARLTIAVDLHADIMGKATKPGNKFPTVAGFDVFDENDVPQRAQEKIKSSGMARRLFRREENSPSLFGVMVSSLSIMQDRLTRSRMAGDPPDIHIKPKIGHIGMLEFEKAEELIALGEDAALRVIDDIRDAAQMLLPR